MLPPARLARPSLGKEALALFYWLVLRTMPYLLIIKTLKLHNPIIHVILKILKRRVLWKFAEIC